MVFRKKYTDLNYIHMVLRKKYTDLNYIHVAIFTWLKKCKLHSRGFQKNIQI